MTTLDEFDPKRDGWSFENWGDTVPFSWDLYRQTYLAINPTNDPVEAPLDVAFYEIFKNCSTGGNCGGMCLLALAMFEYGGYMGYCAPPNFFDGPPGPNGPSRPDLRAAINIMQARQFSAPGIRNFLDVVKAGQLNDGVAAWHRIQSGLASGDVLRADGEIDVYRGPEAGLVLAVIALAAFRQPDAHLLDNQAFLDFFILGLGVRGSRRDGYDDQGQG